MIKIVLVILLIGVDSQGVVFEDEQRMEFSTVAECEQIRRQYEFLPLVQPYVLSGMYCTKEFIL